MFSTWSVLRFFSDEAAVLMPHWAHEAGQGMRELLQILIGRIDLPELLKYAMSPDGIALTSDEFFRSSCINPEASLYALLFQTGCLTLVKPFFKRQCRAS